MDNYILNEEGQPVVEPDILKWGQWFHTANRHVGKTNIGDVVISTVFLGMDHGYGDGPPVLYETMVFGGEHDGYDERYCTRDEAAAGHERAVAKVRSDDATHN